MSNKNVLNDEELINVAGGKSAFDGITASAVSDVAAKIEVLVASFDNDLKKLLATVISKLGVVFMLSGSPKNALPIANGALSDLNQIINSGNYPTYYEQLNALKDLVEEIVDILSK